MTNPAPVLTLPPAPPAAAAAKKKVPEIHRANKTVFTPCHTSHVHPAKNHWRQQIVIEAPGSFNGTRGSHKATIDEDSVQFVFKIPPNSFVH